MVVAAKDHIHAVFRKEFAELASHCDDFAVKCVRTCAVQTLMHKHEFPFRIGILEVVFKPSELVFAESVGGGVVGVENGEVSVCVIEGVVFAVDCLRAFPVFDGVVEVSAHCARVILVVSRGEEHRRVESEILIRVERHTPLIEVLAVVAHIACVEDEVEVVDAFVFEESVDCFVAVVVHALNHALNVRDSEEFK